MEFRILGPLEVVEDGRRLDLGGPKQRALLAALLLRANEVVSQDALIDDLWGESPPATAAKTLQAYVSRLRKALADAEGEPATARLETHGHGYVLRIAPESLDAAVVPTPGSRRDDRRSAGTTRSWQPIGSVTRWRSGAGRPSPTSRTSRSPSRRSLASRSSA